MAPSTSEPKTATPLRRLSRRCRGSCSPLLPGPTLPPKWREKKKSTEKGRPRGGRGAARGGGRRRRRRLRSTAAAGEARVTFFFPFSFSLSPPAFSSSFFPFFISTFSARLLYSSQASLSKKSQQQQQQQKLPLLLPSLLPPESSPSSRRKRGQQTKEGRRRGRRSPRPRRCRAGPLRGGARRYLRCGRRSSRVERRERKRKEREKEKREEKRDREFVSFFEFSPSFAFPPLFLFLEGEISGGAGRSVVRATPAGERGSEGEGGARCFSFVFFFFDPVEHFCKKRRAFFPLKVSAVRRKLQKKTRDLFSLRIVSTSSSEKNSLVGKKEKKADSLFPLFCFPPLQPSSSLPFPLPGAPLSLPPRPPKPPFGEDIPIFLRSPLLARRASSKRA